MIYRVQHATVLHAMCYLWGGGHSVKISASAQAFCVEDAGGTGNAILI